jgi:hypothetical protein
LQTFTRLPRGGEDRIVASVLFRYEGFEHFTGDRVEPNDAGTLGFSEGKVKLATFEADLPPAQLVLFGHSHARVDRKDNVRPELGKEAINSCQSVTLLLVAQEPKPTVDLLPRTRLSPSAA